MIKLTGSVNRKVPIPGTEYSSQSFGAGMETEVGNDASFEEIKARFQEMYQVLENAVKAQIASNGVSLSGNPDKSSPPENNHSTEAPITPSQQKLVEKLVREQKIFGQERIRLLNIKSKEAAKHEIKNLLSQGPQKR